MDNSWIETEAIDFIKTHGPERGDDIALLAYATRLVGNQSNLAMHGGGNTSIKKTVTTLCGDAVPALFVKASGVAMDAVTPRSFVCLDNGYLRKLRVVSCLSDKIMAAEFRTHMLIASDALPSIETLMHAFIDTNAIIHTHPAAILTLTNRSKGEETIAEALGGSVGVVSSINSGLALGRAVADLWERGKEYRAIVVMQHGLITWGMSLKEAYDRTIEIVTRAEQYIRASRRQLLSLSPCTETDTAQKRYAAIAPLLRGLLSPASDDPDNPYQKMILAPLISRETLDLLDSSQAKDLLCTAPLTPDYLIRTKAYPLFIEKPDYEDMNLLRQRLTAGIEAFGTRYGDYVQQYSSRLPEIDVSSFDLLPRVLLLPGLGAVCAAQDITAACIVRDITEQALMVKREIHETNGTYLGPTEDHLFNMEFRALQRTKIAEKGTVSLRGRVAVVTGAAGAIGSAICDELLGRGCHVAVTDLAGDLLDSTTLALEKTYGSRVLGVPLDVTDSASVAAAFEKIVAAFGGIDITIINAGLAHVSPLMEMNLDTFRKLERVNVDGTLLMLAHAGKIFRQQGITGDIVLISTKNVFAPGAKFGAYSATKAAAHQLCRIASLEFADMGVRVNMVSPDAVFSHGAKRSGLWAQVGPDRMKARGLDEKGLEAYYQNRNLLKMQVTAKHVARAVIFFVTHQTPTTGATIPVDGGLPDSTPR